MIDALITDYGGPGLAAVSFFAATLLPFSSEAALLLALHAGLPAVQAVSYASVGNGLACLFNYWLGYKGGALAAEKIRSSKSGNAAWTLLHRFGGLTLLLSWLPVIGDPITVLAGFARISLRLFVPVVLALRVARYVLLASL
jgi:membrane protein YqaA with SNARE-associated domain